MSTTTNQVTLCVLGVSLLAAGTVVGGPVQFQVRPQGTERGRPGVFSSLPAARDAIRKLKKTAGLPEGGVKVVVRGGTYSLDAPLELTEQDSGTANAPVVYQVYRGETARILGGKLVTNWQPVTDPDVLRRLDKSARANVVQADLKALGVADYGSPGGGGVEVFFNRRPMTLARWPNKGFVRIPKVYGKTPRNVRGTKGCVEGIFGYEGDRPKRWVDEKDPWVHGYWFWDWSDQRHPLKSIDTKKHRLEVKPPYHHYGYRAGQWFYAYNLLAEIDQPGEWYVDRDAGILYFWPPTTKHRSSLGAAGSGETLVSVLPTLVTMKNVSHVTLRGFLLEGCRGTAVSISGGAENRIVGCTIRNIGGAGVRVSGGNHHGVVGCDLYQLGAGGISLSGGNRKTLTPARHFAENNHVHHYARIKRVYQPGITLSGVGNRASHNLIDNAPHMGMGFGGNDHVIEYNEIHSVCYESNDAGAIYTGRDWTQRGTVIRFNYLHHINGFRGRGCVGVYLDDMFCGTTIFGNLFYEVTRAAFIGGGRDNIVDNNLFVDCRPALHIDNRAQGWAKGSVHTTMKTRLEAMPYLSPLWRLRYPKLVNILNDDPAAPRGNLIRHNVSFGGRWDEVTPGARKYVTFEDNLTDEDPHFVSPDRFGRGKTPKAVDFALKPDSPAWAIGFHKLPLKQIGLFEDATRASWPVLHSVRPSTTPPVKQTRRTGPPPTLRIGRTQAVVVIDGSLSPTEWQGLKGESAVPIQQGINGEKTGPPSRAWLLTDGTSLFIAVDNEVTSAKPVSQTNEWGRDDAVEVALRDPAGGRTAPIFVLRGYPNGHFESSTEAGAPAAAATKAGKAVRFAAKVVDRGRWTAEFCIPLPALGIAPRKHRHLQFNLTVRKSAQPVWIMWQGTHGYSWQVDQAGFVQLPK